MKVNIHREAEEYYRQKFSGKYDSKEKYGDFFIESNEDGIIGFEVYAPEEPPSISTKNLKENALRTETRGNVKFASIGGGLDSDRFNQLLERVLTVKSHQFTNKVNWPKILIICYKYPGAFSSLDGSFKFTPIPNRYAKYTLTKETLDNLAKTLQNKTTE